MGVVILFRCPLLKSPFRYKKFNQKTQLLCSYYIKFNFISDAGVLNYLNGKEIKLDDNNFIK